MRLQGSKTPTRKEIRSITARQDRPSVCSKTGHLKLSFEVITQEKERYCFAIVNGDLMRLRQFAAWFTDPKAWREGSVMHADGQNPVLHVISPEAPPESTPRLDYKRLRDKHHLAFPLIVGLLKDDEIFPIPTGGIHLLEK